MTFAIRKQAPMRRKYTYLAKIFTVKFQSCFACFLGINLSSDVIQQLQKQQKRKNSRHSVILAAGARKLVS